MFFQRKHEETAVLQTSTCLTTWRHYYTVCLRCCLTETYFQVAGGDEGYAKREDPLGLAASSDPFISRPGIMHIPVKSTGRVSYGRGGVSQVVCQQDDLDRSHVWRFLGHCLKTSLFWPRNAKGRKVKNPSPNRDISTMATMARPSYWSSLLKAGTFERILQHRTTCLYRCCMNTNSHLNLLKKPLFNTYGVLFVVKYVYIQLYNAYRNSLIQIPEIHTIYKGMFPHISKDRKERAISVK